MTASNNLSQSAAHSAGQLADSLSTFFDLARSVSLSQEEECALMDLPTEMVARIKSSPLDGLPLDRVKLRRRVDYAIPILQLMLASLRV